MRIRQTIDNVFCSIMMVCCATVFVASHEFIQTNFNYRHCLQG